MNNNSMYFIWISFNNQTFDTMPLLQEPVFQNSIGKTILDIRVDEQQRLLSTDDVLLMQGLEAWQRDAGLWRSY